VGALIDLVTLTFDLEKLLRIIARGVNNLPTNFDVSRSFCSLLIGQHLSDTSRDLATLTIDLLGHGACWWCGSLSTVYIPSLKFVGLSIQKIRCTSGLNIMSTWWPWPLPLTLKLVRIIAGGVDNLPTNFGVSKTFRPWLIGQHMSRITWPCDLDLWPRMSQRLLLMRIYLLRLFTKFELRRPSRSEHIAH